MSVLLYTGHVGSGKTYEVIKSVILPALRKGRAVVTNIDGLSLAAVRAYLQSQGCETCGPLFVVDRNDPARPDFFPARQADGSYLPSEWVPLGALVVMDECHQYWGSGRDLLPAHVTFMTEHRHIVGSDGVACDFVLISQTADAVHRNVKGLVENSFDCRKLTALGLDSKYAITTYVGARRSGKYVMQRQTHSYDREIFPLYRSFAAEQGRSVQVDARRSMWSNRRFLMVLGAAPLLVVAAGLFVWGRLVSPQVAHVVSRANNLAVSPADAAARPAVPVPAPVVKPAVPPTDLGGELPGERHSLWHLSGAVRIQAHWWAVLSRPGFPLRYLPISACVVAFGEPIQCRVGDEVVLPSSPTGLASSSPGSPSPLQLFRSK